MRCFGRCRTGLLIALAVLGISVSACSSSSNAGASNSSGLSSSERASLTSEIAKYEQTPSTAYASQVPDAPAFPASKDAGKLVYYIGLSDLDHWFSYQETGVQEAGQMTGVKVVIWHNQGQVSEWIAGINAAITAHANAVILGAQDPAALQPYIAQMHAAGIKVVSALSYAKTQTLPPGPDAYVGGALTKSQQIAADWVILHSGGKADVLFQTSDDVPNSPALYAATKQEFAAKCPKCKIRRIDVPIASWGTQLAPDVEAAIAKDPNLNYVMPVYDSASPFAVTGISSEQATGRVHIVTSNGSAAVLDEIRTGNTVTMDIGQSELNFAFDTFDQALRLMEGLKPWPIGNSNVPIRIFYKGNVTQAGNPAQFGLGYGSLSSIRAAYAKLWELSS